MKILLVYHHWAVSSGRYMTTAFERLGHTVRHIGPAHGRSIWGMDVDAKYVWEPEVANSRWDIDGTELIIVMDSDPQLLDSAKGLNVGAPIVVYGVDNHVRDYRRPHFDHYFLAHRGVSLMAWEEKRPMSDLMQQQLDVLMPTMKRDDPLRPNFPSHVAHKDMTHLPCAYDPTLFIPSPIPYAEREYDVAMIGVMYPQRWQLVQELRAAGLKVLAGTGLIYDQYVAAYHNARISLCVSAAGDVAQRVFETAMLDCVIVTDELADAKRLNLMDGMNCYTYSSQDEAVAICKWLSGDESARPLKYDNAVEGKLRGLAATILSRTWAKGETWDARAQVIIDWLQKQQAEQAGEAFYATAE